MKNILIVEDNLEHLKITEYLLRKSGVPVNYIIVRDGQEVLDYLYRRNIFADTDKYPMPDLILLDLNLPKCDGREVLKSIKTDVSLRSIPIIIVSTSDREEDREFACQLGVSGYISKSIGFDNFSIKLGELVKSLC